MSRETRRCRTTTPPTPACSGCSTARRCGAPRPAPPAAPAPTATAMRATSMKGVAARYPAFDAARGRPVDLEQRINLCRTERQQAPPLRLREPRSAGADRLRRAPVARPADRDASDERLAAVPRRRARAVQPAPGPAQSRLRAVPRRQLGQEARRQRHPAGAPDRLSALPAGMAEPRLAAAPAAQLPDRHARGALRVRRAGIRRARAFLMWRARGMPIETPAVRP